MSLARDIVTGPVIDAEFTVREPMAKEALVGKPYRYVPQTEAAHAQGYAPPPRRRGLGEFAMRAAPYLAAAKPVAETALGMIADPNVSVQSVKEDIASKGLKRTLFEHSKARKGRIEKLWHGPEGKPKEKGVFTQIGEGLKGAWQGGVAAKQWVGKQREDFGKAKQQRREREAQQRSNVSGEKKEASMKPLSALDFLKWAEDPSTVEIGENINWGFWRDEPQGRGPETVWNGPAVPPMKSISPERVDRAIEYAQAHNMGPGVMAQIRAEGTKTMAQEAIHASARNS